VDKNKSSFEINLRAVEPEDLDLMYLWENDRTVWYVSNTLIPFSRNSLRLYIDSEPNNIFLHKQLRMMIDRTSTSNNTEKPDSCTVGSIDLFDFDPIHQRAGLGILIASPADRQKGYAYEAIVQMISYCRKILLLHQLYCNIPASNTASIGLFEKAGFEITGIKKEWLRTETKREDVLFMQLILS